MSKHLLLNEITDLMSGRTHEQIFYFSGSYKAVEEDRLTAIAPQQAAEYLSSGSRLIYIVQDCRQWDDTLKTFTGEEPTHPPLPEVPEGADVTNVTCAFDPLTIVEVFSGHRFSKGSD